MKGWPRSWMKKINVHTGTLIQPEDVEIDQLAEEILKLRGDRR